MNDLHLLKDTNSVQWNITLPHEISSVCNFNVLQPHYEIRVVFWNDWHKFSKFIFRVGTLGILAQNGEEDDGEKTSREERGGEE